MRKKSLRVVLLLALAAVVSAALLLADAKKKAASLDKAQRAEHAVSRLTFGARPGEVERVEQMGVEKWIELQLRPEKIEDGALDARLGALRTLKMSTREMVETFPPPQVLRAVAEGRASMPSDPQKRAVYENALAVYKARQERRNENGKSDKGDAAGADKTSDEMTPEEKQARREARLYADLRAQEVLDMEPDQRYAAIMKMTPQERMAATRALSDEERQQILQQMSPQQRESLMALMNPQQVVAQELMQGKVLRAIYSERQLDEVMTDFWFNHFNVFINKGADRYLITAYERDVIRPRALGKFKDLLLATAKSPAMLFYLDNWESVGPDSQFALGGPGRNGPRPRRGFNQNPNVYRPNVGRTRGPVGNSDEAAMRSNSRNGAPDDAAMQAAGQGQPLPRPQQLQQQRRGLNENYAREIMELHTLGVDGGYTQKDVTELAKVLTGWTIRQPRQGGGYEFNERMHEPGTKVVLGHKFSSNDEREGEKAIEMLARHPSTAKFISRKLAMRFVSDDPPPALVERMAQTFQKTDGDIREVLRTLFRSPEFWAPEAYRAKIKTPLEFVASAARATGADVGNAQPLIQALNRMGMPLYGMQPPTGYSMKAETWVNTAALLNRMNFALALSGSKLPGIKVDPQSLLSASKTPQDPEAALAVMENTLLAGNVSATTHQTLMKQLGDQQVTGRQLDDPARPPNLAVLAGLILGSPEFQRR